jgi:hypothetical protein
MLDVVEVIGMAVVVGAIIMELSITKHPTILLQ